MRQVVGIDLDRESVSDETTIKFHYLLEVHQLGAQL